ncbi:MAG: hypothetical protein COW00_15040 [Bdellovibrio sp. CG12_big_fil_rev_8_21_14_0_65_39_13]|nr:MAG: hypothetical protein COW78_00595 [Bdellovibrio sp. CG22_combo_CG10-13_8_21_14_all_39_27]PIQ58607.1 MAG: hypothetical protein COW00_15040 [Bdellovibrio sp. CG12_big_fil_rev_8_21_14_0_65_39_13]PIR33815.1 MAG: hypothetical protein COV37_15000 [Bdellovibrio sp. CG11_big_fil_rev_8_21_14_0_20_39_38]
MMNESLTIPRPFQPFAMAIIGFLFLTVTTLLGHNELFNNLHIELVFLLLSIATTVHLFSKKIMNGQDFPPLVSILILCVFIFICSPLITSLFNQDYLAILKNDEYKSLFKMSLFCPIAYLGFSNKKISPLLLKFFTFFYAILGFYFLYRYLILHEVREYDLRPALKMRHGDANFLCTFFSMMVPLPLMQAWWSYKSNQKINMIIMISTALFLMVCAILTQSRMGLIALLIGMIYLFSKPLISSKVKVALVALLLVFSGALTYSVGENLIHRYSQLSDKSNSDRFLTFKNGFKVFEDNPVIGAGFHRAKYSFYENTQYPHFQSEFRPLEVHNTPLSLLAELGLLGFASFGLIFLMSLKIVSKSTHPGKPFLLCSLFILFLSGMSVGIAYKDLVLLQMIIIAGISQAQLYRGDI